MQEFYSLNCGNTFVNEYADFIVFWKNYASRFEKATKENEQEE